MEKRRYDKEMETTIKGLHTVQPLLLHACCAPCSSAVLERLSEFFEITVYYYNPNIESEEEYRKRAGELKRLIAEMELPRPVHFLEGEFEPEAYRKAVRGLEREKEGGKRCEACFRLRLRKTAETAAKYGFSLFTTTLTISPMKNAPLLNEIGEKCAEEAGVSFLNSDFKKQGGFQRSVELSHAFGLYRQDYCGCTYSKREAEKRRMDLMTEKERAYVTVDLGAVRSNFDELTKDLPQEMKAIAVVKADGYGHGALPIAKMLENDPKLGFFAVATESEAISLSLGEIEKPVLILSHTVPEYDDELIQRKIRFTVASEKRAEELSGAAGKAGAKAFVHLKIDTGMGRIGFFPDEESVKAIKAIAKLPNLVLEGIFTHLSSMDMEDPSFSIGQAEKMERFVNRLKEEGIGFPFVHVGNSAGTILKRGFPSFANATRLGISLYGAAPSGEGNFSSVRLTPAMSFFSRVAFLKTVPAGTPIGYGRTYVTERETVVATVSAGYADGYMRSLSNKGTVLIRGIRCRVIGRVCMDQFMADVTEVPDVSIGDRVLLFGRDGNEELPVSEVAEQAGTIPYELLVRTGVRLTKTVIYG